jgi:hypothetical protein
MSEKVFGGFVRQAHYMISNAFEEDMQTKKLYPKRNTAFL